MHQRRWSATPSQRSHPQLHSSQAGTSLRKSLDSLHITKAYESQMLGFESPVFAHPHITTSRSDDRLKQVPIFYEDFESLVEELCNIASGLGDQLGDQGRTLRRLTEVQNTYAAQKADLANYLQYSKDAAIPTSINPGLPHGAATAEWARVSHHRTPSHTASDPHPPPHRTLKPSGGTQESLRSRRGSTQPSLPRSPTANSEIADETGKRIASLLRELCQCGLVLRDALLDLAPSQVASTIQRGLANVGLVLGTKKKKVKGAFEDLMGAWQSFAMALTLALAQDSSGKTRQVSNNIQKLALATGAPDWEDLTVDDGKSLFLQAEKYLNGFGVTKSPEQAYKRYHASAKCGLPEAMNMMGHLCENGIGCARDVGAAVRWYKEAASHNLADAMNNIGRILENGTGVPQDLVQAGEWYLRSAERGNTEGMTNIGYMLENGIGRDANPSLSIEWYQMAASQGNARAQNALGSCYYRGKGIAQDHGEAVAWFRRAVEQGNPQAQNNLGICYEEGLGVAKDIVMAKALYKAASEQKHASGTNNLGFVLMLEGQWWEAFRCFCMAWALGSADAAYNLGVMHEMGCKDVNGAPIIRQDIDIALRWYREGAGKDSTKSRVRLASLLINQHAHLTPALPRKKALREALKHLRVAAAAGSPDAQTLLGELLETGAVGPVSADNTADDDVELRSDEEDGEVDGAGAAEAVRWYQKAAKTGHAGSLYHLAACVEAGVGGVKQDFQKAIKLYEEAQKKGSPEAKARLDMLRSMTDLSSPLGSSATLSASSPSLLSPKHAQTGSKDSLTHRRTGRSLSPASRGEKWQNGGEGGVGRMVGIDDEF
ncbi:hypothetical protein HDU96_009312 [Phlyctochytrium bullatum]|nr:hypothetical protein HDU96_009312 [Phlyctochytrium bullatum]